jgi:Helix-turn-helix domain
VDTKNDVREFLTSRRAKITPDQVDLPVYGDNRRVPGLRREEVALLAGVSVDYYTCLERGNMSVGGRGARIRNCFRAVGGVDFSHGWPQHA